MLRVSLPRARLIGTLAGRQSLLPIATRRAFAQKPSINDHKPIVLPGSWSEQTDEPIPQGPIISVNSANPVTSTTNSAVIDKVPGQAVNVPLTPPEPDVVTPAPTLPAEPADRIPRWIPDQEPLVIKKKRGIFRRLLTTLLLLGIVGFGGGVYYSRINDNFHDFFTEYVPFGEEAVMYLEEQDFRKRFPSQQRPRLRDTGDKVTIPKSSGVYSRISDNPSVSNALSENTPKPKEAQKDPLQATPEEKVKAVEKAKKEAVQPTTPAKPTTREPDVKSPRSTTMSDVTPTAVPEVKSRPSTAKAIALPASTAAPVVERMPEVDEPSRFPAEISRIDPIKVNSAQEPIVQDMVKIVNDIITVVNADNANSRYSSTIQNAKGKIARVGQQVNALKAAAAKDAQDKINANHAEFDRAAKELIKRLEGEMQAQEVQWKEDYEAERKKLHKSYEERLESELQRAKELNEQKLRNELLEQAVEMKKHFTTEVKEQVESERNARLGKLSDLTNTVSELEKLTTGWSSIVDENLKSQHLHVAVDAVRASLENATTPKPFIRELAALKEIASDSPLVDAAIASINPTAYQRGIPSASQLIERFRRVAVQVRKASLLPEEAGVASHASSFVLSKLMFKKKGLADGNDVESILTRTETLLEEGDLDNAAREMNTLQGWAKTLSKDWLGEVRRVLEVKQALDVISTEARLQSLRFEN